MQKIDRRNSKKILVILFILLLAVTAVIFVFTGNNFGNQATSAMYPRAEFYGEYKIGDGKWQKYVKDEHIPANRGDVTLKGNFELIAPDTGEKLGTPAPGSAIAIYLDHIRCSISEDGGEKHTLDVELDIAGEDMCGNMYIGYGYRGGKELTIEINNPHRFGNENAIDELLSNLSIYGGVNFEKDIRKQGDTQRSIGIVFILFAFMILGTALFSMLIHIKGSPNLWLIGLAVFFAGIYFIYSAKGVMFWSEVIKLNTRMLGMSMMFYILSVQAVITSILREKIRPTGKIFLTISAVLTLSILVLSMLGNVRFYDTWFIWAIAQCIICIFMACFMIQGFVSSKKNDEMLFAFGMLPMIAFSVDVFANFFGWWQGGYVSAITFIVLFLAALVMLLSVIPGNVNAAMMARELEAEKKALKAELAESRIAIMISQIQPHFIYNTLGTIEQLCISDPEAASKLVRNFSLYLRGNFSELDNSAPICFSQEMNHVKHYTDIEQVRFPDITIQYDLRSVEFFLPALTVQPLVENAIKHGLMGLEEGGIVRISAYETDTSYVVEVTDDGVGFDSSEEIDRNKHVGIKNVRGRIEAMCGGTLTIESTKGKGTCATIRIPKEGKEVDSNNG